MNRNKLGVETLGEIIRIEIIERDRAHRCNYIGEGENDGKKKKSMEQGAKCADSGKIATASYAKRQHQHRTTTTTKTATTPR